MYLDPVTRRLEVPRPRNHMEHWPSPRPEKPYLQKLAQLAESQSRIHCTSQAIHSWEVIPSMQLSLLPPASPKGQKTAALITQNPVDLPRSQRPEDILPASQWGPGSTWTPAPLPTSPHLAPTTGRQNGCHG
jgi:hypothetical protein